MIALTPLGYVAVAKSNAHLVRSPKVLQQIPVRLAAAAGFVYFTGSFILLQSSGGLRFYAPLAGIGAAFGVFVYRTVTLVSGWLYPRRLRGYERRGLIVVIPFDLIAQAQKISPEREVQDMLAGATMRQTSALVTLHQEQGYSPKVNKMLRKLMTAKA